ncbi:MAG: ArnT family glycosyltransferase [Paracoccaceae bacterium]
MPTQRADWLPVSLAIVGIVTALRLLALALSNADIFVDEAQYWLWGQNLDFGYYSKPPLAAWVIRATTELAGSNSPFWLRFPVPLFHGATALILGAIAARLFGRLPAIWVAASYITFPIVAVGSALISTDTIMAPFYAAGLLFYLHLVETGRSRDAVLAGGMIGLAFMAKYAGVYFLLCAVIAAIAVPDFRISKRNILTFIVAFTIVISSNIIWNLTHDLTTVQHTLDNVDWVRADSGRSGLNPQSFIEFIASQFIAVGPIIFATLFILLRKTRSPKITGLLAFSLPIILLVAVQALLSRAYANWAFAAYFAGTLATVPWLLIHARKWLIAGMVFNITFCVLLPLLTIFGDEITLGKNRPILSRYMGRDELSQKIIDLAHDLDTPTIVAANRDILADLFYTGHDQDIRIFSVAPKGRAEHYYQQLFSFVPETANRILFITSANPLRCREDNLTATAAFETSPGNYQSKDIFAYLLEPGCYSSLK